MKLGKLEQIRNLHSVWAHEEQEFTPWLALEENLALLAETLGLDGLELVGREMGVGAFFADIVARNTAPDSGLVVIENMFGKSDHDHLGKCLTYASGQKARTVVLIAEKLREEHRAALDWLNEITSEDHAFFGCELELWRIGESAPAPRFNVVVQPNDWVRNATGAKKSLDDSELSDTRRIQRAYWTAVETLVGERSGPLNPISAPAQSWLTHGIGKTGVGLGMAMHNGEKWIRVEIYFSGKAAKSRFFETLNFKEEIEGKLGLALDWQHLPEKQDSRVCVYLHDADPRDKTDWPRQHAWLVDTATKFHQVFRPYISQLNGNLNDGVRGEAT